MVVDLVAVNPEGRTWQKMEFQREDEQKRVEREEGEADPVRLWL